jgi:hypothetical protein
VHDVTRREMVKFLTLGWLLLASANSLMAYSLIASGFVQTGFGGINLIARVSIRANTGKSRPTSQRLRHPRLCQPFCEVFPSHTLGFDSFNNLFTYRVFNAFEIKIKQHEIFVRSLVCGERIGVDSGFAVQS